MDRVTIKSSSHASQNHQKEAEHQGPHGEMGPKWPHRTMMWPWKPQMNVYCHINAFIWVTWRHSGRRCWSSTSFPFQAPAHTLLFSLCLCSSFFQCLCQPHCAPVFSRSPHMGRLFSQSKTALPSMLAPLRSLAARQGQHDRIFPPPSRFLSPFISLRFFDSAQLSDRLLPNTKGLSSSERANKGQRDREAGAVSTWRGTKMYRGLSRCDRWSDSLMCNGNKTKQQITQHSCLVKYTFQRQADKIRGLYWKVLCLWYCTIYIYHDIHRVLQ